MSLGSLWDSLEIRTLRDHIVSTVKVSDATLLVVLRPVDYGERLPNNESLLTIHARPNMLVENSLEVV